MPDRVSLLVVDPTVLYRESLAAALLAEAWVAEVRTAADAEGAVSALAESRPDVVLVGVSGADALRGVRVLRALSPSSRVVAIASSEDDDEVVTCAEAGLDSSWVVAGCRLEFGLIGLGARAGVGAR